VEIDRVTGNPPCFGDVEVGFVLPSSTVHADSGFRA